MNDKIWSHVDCANTLGECPLWSSTRQELWWIDVANPALWRVDKMGVFHHWKLPKPPTALVLAEDDHLIIFFRRGETHIAIEKIVPGAAIPVEYTYNLGEERFNDAAVSPDGRIMVGTMDRKQERPVGKLYAFDGQHDLRILDDGFQLSNGIDWSPDGTTLYFAETTSRNIYAYRYFQGATISHRQVFAHIEEDGGPDGLTVDSDGNIWVALFGGGEIRCFYPDGKIKSRIILPSPYPTSCCFGDSDLKTLFITTASRELTGERELNSPCDGSLLKLRTDVAGKLPSVARLKARA